MKFGTYTRDSYTGLDYADQRFFASTYGRFNTPDPARSAKLKNPASWNRYAYVSGDPVNKKDPRGLCIQTADGTFVDTDAESDPFAYYAYLQEGATDLGDGACVVFEADSYLNSDIPYGNYLYAAQMIQEINGNNPGGLLDGFMLSSVMAGSGGSALAAEAFADGIIAAENLMVLGPKASVDAAGIVMSSWVDVGSIFGAQMMNTSDAAWTALGFAGQRAAMAGFIQQGLNAGAQIIFTADPSLAPQDSGTWFEWQYILDQGYKVVQEGTSWIVQH